MEKCMFPQRRRDAEISAEKTKWRRFPPAVRLHSCSLRLSQRLCVSAGNRPLLSPPPLIRRQRHAQHQGLGAEVQAPIGLIAIPDAQELEDTILVDALFHLQKLPELAGFGGAEIDPRVESGHQELKSTRL